MCIEHLSPFWCNYQLSTVTVNNLFFWPCSLFCVSRVSSMVTWRPCRRRWRYCLRRCRWRPWDSRCQNWAVTLRSWSRASDHDCRVYRTQRRFEHLNAPKTISSLLRLKYFYYILLSSSAWLTLYFLLGYGEVWEWSEGPACVSGAGSGHSHVSWTGPAQSKRTTDSKTGTFICFDPEYIIYLSPIIPCTAYLNYRYV